MTNQYPRWTPPPNWPSAPEGWRPPEGWAPDPAWGPAPAEWNFWPGEPAKPPPVAGPNHARSVSETQPLALPGIESYPGFVTAKQVRRGRLTSRPVVGIATGIVGLMLGMSVNQGAVDDAAAKAQDKADTRIALIRTEAADDVSDAQEEATQVQEEAIQKAVDEAVDETVADERARAKKLVSEATAKAKKEAGAAAKPQPLVSATDPHFGTCGEANANGYGNYRRGTDTEYSWYQDRDGDGVVCE